jgi:RNA polymerase sigma-54 factor
MLKQQLQQKLQQKLSPAQIQVIKMLEVPTLELEERIRQEIEENPALEEGAETNDDEFDEDFNNEDGGNNDDFDIDDYVADDDIPDYKLKVNNSSKDDKHEDIPFSAGMTFHENLMDQLC